jgi:hypothetical protein
MSMRHALITTYLLNQARDAAIAQAEADERLEYQAQDKARTQPAGPGRFARVIALARCVRGQLVLARQEPNELVPDALGGASGIPKGADR